LDAITPRTTRILERLPAGVTAAAAAYLLIATTVGFYWLDSWHDEQRATQLVLLGVIGLAAAWLAIARRPAVALRLAPAVLVTLALGLVSSVLSDRPFDALAEVSLFSLLCVLAAVVAAFARTADSGAVLWVSRGALFIAAAHVVGAFTRHAAAVGLDHSLGIEIWLVGFSNPRVASSFYALMIPFVAAATIPQAEPDRRLRAVAWIVLIGLWAVATGLEARSLWMAYAVAVPVLVVMAWTPLTRRMAVTIGAAALLGVLLQFALQLPFTSEAAAFSGTTRDLVSLSAREVLWRLAFSAILDSPVLGIGPVQFTSFESYAGAHPHNWVLQLASEWGLLALLAVLAGLFGLLRRLRPKLRDAQSADHLLTAASLSVLIGLSSALVDGTLVMPTTQIQFALVFGLMIGRIKVTTTKRQAVTTFGFPRVAMSGAIVGATLALWSHALSTYPVQISERAAFQQRFPSKWLVPRLWENGLTLTREPMPGHD
jgi:O-antigen ligase